MNETITLFRKAGKSSNMAPHRDRPLGQRGRELWIDVAKGLSMLAVVLGHQGQSQVGRIVFPFHLMIFFLLSGYTLKVKPVTGDYVATKFTRLMKPYFFTCLAVIVLDVLNLLVNNRDLVPVTQLVANDLIRSFAGSGDLRTLGVIELPSRIGAIWFFPAMFLAIVGTQLILNYVPKYRYHIGVGLIFLAQMSVSVGWMPFSVQSAMMAIFFVLLGHDIKTHKILSKLRPMHYVIAAVIFAAGIWGRFTIYFVRAYMTDPVISSVTGLGGCLLVYGLSRILSGNRILAYTGQYSSYFLGVHLMEMETLRKYYRQLTDQIIQHIPERVLQMDHMYDVVHFIIQVGLELILIYSVTVCVVTLSNRVKQRHTVPQPAVVGSRMASVDMAKGMLMVLVIVNGYPIAEEFGSIIASFCLLAFVVLSGLFFKPYSPLQRLKKDFRLLIFPYLLFSMVDVVVKATVQGTSVWTNVQEILLCMSASEKLFPHVASVVPASFLLMIVLVRVGYCALQTYLPKQITILVALGTLCGIWLGQAGLWLPWSLDVALYLLLPYHMGRIIRDRGVLDWVKNHPQCYFLLVLPWAYSVSCGGIEAATRTYGTYTYGILGAVCATLLLYLLFDYVAHSAIPQMFQRILAAAGRYGIWILISHTLLEALVLAPVLTKVTTRHNLMYLGVAIVFDVFMGWLLGWLYDKITAVFLRQDHIQVGQ